MKLKLLLFEFQSPIVLRDTVISGSTILHAIYNHLNEKQRSRISISSLRMFVPYKINGRMVSTKEIKVSTYSQLRDWRMGRPQEGNIEQVSKLDIHFRDFNGSRHMIVSNEAGFVNYDDKDLTRKVQATAYVHCESDIADEVFQNISIGGKRNLGFGKMKLLDSKVIDTDELKMDVESDYIYLMSPFCLESDFPGSEGTGWPKWWSVDGYRERDIKLFHSGKLHNLKCVDEDQIFFASEHRNPWDGITRFGNHRKYGFGEWYLAGGIVSGKSTTKPKVTTSEKDVVKHLNVNEEKMVEKEVILPKMKSMKVSAFDFF